MILSIEQGSGIVGGYTRRPWRSSGGEAPDPTRSTFVFALRNRRGDEPFRLQPKEDTQNVVFHDSRFGAVFLNVLCAPSGVPGQCIMRARASHRWVGARGLKGLFIEASRIDCSIDRMEVWRVR